MEKTMQVQRKKGKLIRLAEVKLSFETYAWNRLPKSNNLLSLKDKLRLDIEREDLMDMQRAFING